jgi:hypothetical protein
VSQGAEYDYRQGLGSADPYPAFFLIADPDLGLFCEFNSNFLGNFFFSYPYSCYLEDLLLRLKMSKASKRAFKKIFKL